MEFLERAEDHEINYDEYRFGTVHLVHADSLSSMIRVLEVEYFAYEGIVADKTSDFVPLCEKAMKVAAHGQIFCSTLQCS